MKKHISRDDQIYFEEIVVGPSMDTTKQAVEDGVSDECMMHCIMWPSCEAVIFHFSNYTDNMNCELLQLDLGEIITNTTLQP